MQRPDFEIAMLELDSMTEDINHKYKVAKNVREELFKLQQEGYEEFKHFPPLTDNLFQCFLVALDRVQYGKPKRWFDEE